MAAPEIVLELVERFDRNRTAYKSDQYNEARLRIEFLNPFFEALGWDVNNKQGYAEAYKEVIYEDAIKIGKATKAPDYCFRIGGTRKFFVEAKKPAVNLKDATEPAFQLRRYAWSAKLPLSILTDFEEFAIYDCRIKPDQSDKATSARIIYLPYTDYPQRWDEIASIFSREAILKGSFDTYAEATKGKRGTAEVDTAFLQEIDSWREMLARHLASRNKKLTQRELNFAVQMTIDRIIFLRICEDRGIEEYERLRGLLKGTGVYGRLCDLFREADDRYNSGLFHFQKEKDVPEPPDTLTPSLIIDDKPLKEIVKRLYYPDSPYEFSALPADVLGQVYEQFLGKVILLSPSHQVTVEEKPEVRKAGGVYYTPTFIVDYIVSHTLSKLLEGKKPGPRGGASKIRIVDPACGSGSFLIVAYQYLLDWHRDRYVEDGPEKHSRELYQGPGGLWLLTSQERKRILLNNIYGVDIDPQAVEVTKLSLLLKVLEGESNQTLVSQLRLFHERALPDLDNNIKCGNSLIGPDFYKITQMNLFDEEERYRINVFDWVSAFPEIFSNNDSGFDAVIGNPPYLSIDDTWGRGDPRLSALKEQYPDIYNDKTDILFYFLGKAVTLSKGAVSFIVSRAFIEAYKADKLRSYLVSHTAVQEIIDFRNLYVFPGVGITTSIITLQLRTKPERVKVYQLLTEKLPSLEVAMHLSNPEIFEQISVPQSSLGSGPWLFVSEAVASINARIDKAGETLDKVLAIGQGMQTGRNNVFGGHTAQEIAAWELKSGQFYKRASNSDIQRFTITDKGKYLLYLEDVPTFSQLPQVVQDYLSTHASELKERAAFQRGDCEWWRYTWPLHKEWYDRKRILCPFLAPSNRFALDLGREYIGLTDTTVLFDNGQPEDLRYLVGLLNSRLLTFRFKSIGKLKSNGILEYFWNSISKLPIRRINFSGRSDKARHDRMVELVEQMLSLHRRLADARMPHDKIMFQQQIDITDKQIDRLVYELYGLTEEEIKLVEGTHREEQ